MGLHWLLRLCKVCKKSLVSTNRFRHVFFIQFIISTFVRSTLLVVTLCFSVVIKSLGLSTEQEYNFEYFVVLM